MERQGVALLVKKGKTVTEESWRKVPRGEEISRESLKRNGFPAGPGITSELL